jgi:hypothetical protein
LLENKKGDCRLVKLRLRLQPVALRLAPVKQKKDDSGGKAAFGAESAGASHSVLILKEAAAGARVRGRPAAFVRVHGRVMMYYSWMDERFVMFYAINLFSETKLLTSR